jgi:hypothetical protein
MQDKGARFRKPQNLVEFCSAKPVPPSRLPGDIDNERFELLAVEFHHSLSMTVKPSPFYHASDVGCP